MQYSTEAFNDEDLDAIYRFLGYANWRAMASSFQLGYPSASQPFFLVQDAVTRVAPETRARVRLDVARALEVECQIQNSIGRLKASKVGEVTLNPMEHRQLLSVLQYWTTRIADALGVVPNPYAQGAAGFGGGINAKVVG